MSSPKNSKETMAEERVIWSGEDARKYSLDLVGGKGFNLLRLFDYAQTSGLFVVPQFFIIPLDVQTWFRLGEDNQEAVSYNTPFVENAFDKLAKPCIVRSTSPLEDGLTASFAGKFLTLQNISAYQDLVRAIASVKNSAIHDSIKEYANEMGVKINQQMPVIVQEQVLRGSQKVVMQLEEDGAAQETFYGKNGEDVDSREYDYNVLEKLCADKDVEKWARDPSEKSLFNLPHIGEGQYYYALQVARRAKDSLGLEGTVQVEAFLNGKSKPFFVQIRQLPKLKNVVPGADLDITPPAGVPYIQSEICNGVSGDLTLPAYVTFSQEGFYKILIETGQRSEGVDERSDMWRDRSKLYINPDFMRLSNLQSVLDLVGLNSPIGLKTFNQHDAIWEAGNSLFPEYVLVCDKLDESVVGMARVTTGKKAIITCLEAKKTSHAMTVARDLGIPAMGFKGDIMDLDYFYNQVETGDTVRMKSNGRKAVAYIEKRRERKPYSK